MFYFLALKHFQKADIGIEKEITDEDFEMYDLYMHSNVFPPKNPEGVKEISMDGNEKGIVKCGAADAPSKRTGRPPARDGEKKSHIAMGASC